MNTRRKKRLTRADIFRAELDPENGGWGVVDGYGAILYDSDCGIESKAEAEFLAKFHTDNPDADFESGAWPAWQAHIVQLELDELKLFEQVALKELQNVS